MARIHISNQRGAEQRGSLNLLPHERQAAIDLARAAFLSTTVDEFTVDAVLNRFAIDKRRAAADARVLTASLGNTTPADPRIFGRPLDLGQTIAGIGPDSTYVRLGDRQTQIVDSNTQTAPFYRPQDATTAFIPRLGR